VGVEWLNLYTQSVFIHIFEFSSSMMKNGTTLGSYVSALVWQFLITPSIIMAMKKKVQHGGAG